MEGWKERMIDEYKELCNRIKKLDDFIQANEERDESIVSDEQYRLMMIQYYAMCAYEGALRARIEDIGVLF